MSSNSKSGAAVAPNKTETAKATTISQNAAPAQVEPKMQAMAKTIEAQKEKARALQQLFERRGKLASTREELENFSLSNNGQTNKLTLTDGAGVVFNTFNPAVIEQVHKLVLTITAQQLEETEKEILTL